MPPRTILADYREQYPKEFRAWTNMWQRCTNPASPLYQYYGARGIQVCEAWKDFLVFLKDVGLRPKSKVHLDRIDNNGNYAPENVRWAPLTVSYLNRRANGRPPKGCRNIGGRWHARIKIKQKEIHLGVFDSEQKAHQAYLEAKEKYAKASFIDSFVSS